MVAKPTAPVRREDMGHKNPPLSELNKKYRQEDADNRALFGGAMEEARKAFVSKFSSGMMRRTQKNLRAPD